MIQIEFFKVLGEEGITVLHKICQKVWETGVWPRQWKQSVFIPIPKKGDLKQCTNYRTIALISHASKVLLKVIQRRLEPIMEASMPDTQAGFRRARGTRDHIANMRWIMETSREFQKEVYACFIDNKKAFDCVDHRKLWDALSVMGVPKYMVDLMRSLYSDQEASVRTEHGPTDWFGI